MIHFMENYLRCPFPCAVREELADAVRARHPSGELLPVLLPAAIQIFHLDILIAGRLAHTLQ